MAVILHGDLITPLQTPVKVDKLAHRARKISCILYTSSPLRRLLRPIGDTSLNVSSSSPKVLKLPEISKLRAGAMNFLIENTNTVYKYYSVLHSLWPMLLARPLDRNWNLIMCS